MDKAQEVLESPLREQLWNSPDASGFSRADTNKKRLGKTQKFFESLEQVGRVSDVKTPLKISLLLPALKDPHVSRPNNKLNIKKEYG